jgi:rubrerythrin
MSAAAKGPQAIETVEELLAHAHQIEVEAQERYELLADQMEVHNNLELAELFRKLAGHEKHHAEEILALAEERGLTLPELKYSEFKWGDEEGPETGELERAHYLMTPWHALQMALRAEKRAFAFFDRIAAVAKDAEMTKWAEEFRQEEAEHVAHVEALLEKHPKPAEDWAEDMDPPLYLE